MRAAPGTPVADAGITLPALLIGVNGTSIDNRLQSYCELAGKGKSGETGTFEVVEPTPRRPAASRSDSSRRRCPHSGAPELPPPLPPETRTIGQVVAESVRLYQRRFWLSLSLGCRWRRWTGSRSRYRTAGRSSSCLSQAQCCSARRSSAPPRSPPTYCLTPVDHGGARGGGARVPAVSVPRARLRPAGLAWLAFLGLSVPAAVIERLGVRASLRRAATCPGRLHPRPRRARDARDRRLPDQERALLPAPRRRGQPSLIALFSRTS